MRQVRNRAITVQPGIAGQRPEFTERDQGDRVAGATSTSLESPPPKLAPAPFEIRNARPDEVEEALALQRAAFDLSDPDPTPHLGRSRDLRVVVADGRIVSCLTLAHAELCMRGARIPMGAVRHVATHPDEQNKGYASALMRDSLRWMRRQGLVTSVLFPFSFRYYRKLGYELGGNHLHFWCRPNCVPVYAEGRDARPAALEDSDALARFYAQRGPASACCICRDDARWREILSDPRLSVIVVGESALRGYAVTMEARDHYGGPVLQVMDMTAGDPAAWRALLGRLSQAAVESLEWFASETDLAESGLMRSPAPLREGFKPRGIATIRPMFQFRVVDVEQALQARSATFPDGQYRLALRVHDELADENPTAIAVHGTGPGAEIRRARASDPYLEMEIQIFSQLFCGYLSAGDALSQGLVRASSPLAHEVAEQLFPAGDPFISELDRF